MMLDDGGICIKLKQKRLTVINRYLADKIIEIHSGKALTGRWIIGVIFAEMMYQFVTIWNYKEETISFLYTRWLRV